MLTYPHFNPIALELGPVQVHWYGLMYLFGFIVAWWLAKYRAQKWNLWSSEHVADMIFYSALGVIIGGRVGYMVFYNFSVLIEHPLQLFRIWQGGMSFHGGLIGVCVALYLCSRRLKCSVLNLTDFLAPLVPIGLGAGRIGNFINGELWGRVTSSSWGMVFPNADPLPRYPVQLLEFFLEGVVLFIVMWCYTLSPRLYARPSALFLMLYGSFRFFAEFFRQPDVQLGFVAWGWLTMGQLLCLPMVLLGVFLWVKGPAFEKSKAA